MISTRLPSEAELIELENWLDRREYSAEVRSLEPARGDHWSEWRRRLRKAERNDIAREQIRALLELARTVKNQEK